jgi:hypothetical protein
MAWDGFVCLDLLVVMLAFGLPGSKADMSDASQSTWNGKLVVASVGALFLVGSWWALPQWLWWTCLHVYVPPPPPGVGGVGAWGFGVLVVFLFC